MSVSPIALVAMSVMVSVTAWQEALLPNPIRSELRRIEARPCTVANRRPPSVPAVSTHSVKVSGRMRYHADVIAVRDVVIVSRCVRHIVIAESWTTPTGPTKTRRSESRPIGKRAWIQLCLGRTGQQDQRHWSDTENTSHLIDHGFPPSQRLNETLGSTSECHVLLIDACETLPVLILPSEGGYPNGTLKDVLLDTFLIESH